MTFSVTYHKRFTKVVSSKMVQLFNTLTDIFNEMQILNENRLSTNVCMQQ